MPRRGSTLIELVVTLAIMGLVAGMVTLALQRQSPPTVDPFVRISAARHAALITRRPVTIDLVIDGALMVLTALPDGGVVADTSLHFDRLTGARLHARP
jgi:prepilin-type N-terminal cleavage/methylation domain-containing protein